MQEHNEKRRFPFLGQDSVFRGQVPPQAYRNARVLDDEEDKDK